MATELRQLFREALELTDNDRATLAGLLIESLETPGDPDVESAWTEEAERRWQEIESGKVQTIPWEEIKAKLMSGE
ncbi:MAG: addiction module protein [Pyrinomonadaceae bacterium]|nr:addiction module protein [Pyrinomonadaceae bacterium]